MSARAGRNGRLYMAIASGGSAEPIPFISEWTQDFATDRFDVTSFGDTNKAYVAGLPDAKGSYSGFYDDATAQMYSSAVDGVARKVYWYPDRVNTPGQYFFGTAFLDASMSFPVGDVIKISGSWNAATTYAKVG